MAQSLIIPDPQNAIIEELKQVSRVGSNQTATGCTAIRMLLAGSRGQPAAMHFGNRCICHPIRRISTP